MWYKHKHYLEILSLALETWSLSLACSLGLQGSKYPIIDSLGILVLENLVQVLKVYMIEGYLES